ncbi:MAG: hypothetical protein IPO27_02040 [Bacteroidetes bacterium]|nr:hypothetical protein [Bacteroidota bacterium]
MVQPFSEEELSLISGDYFFVQKNKIFASLHERFLQINNHINKLKEKYNQNLPAEVNRKQGKISRGENYNNLPYMVLDNPNVFSNDGIFAFRLIFLWGKYFTLNIAISGKYFLHYQPYLPEVIKSFSQMNVYQLHDDQLWQHYITSGYREISEDSNFTPLNDFLKLTKVIEFDKVETLKIETLNFYEMFLQNIKHQ